ncbi:LysR family transcriptional regulator [Pseudomonas aeruginosa]|uniref:LysR family transcriptional regulator n=1 Tax=Pseudomonas aeruginosa TaxID=287 RepID=UPI000BB85506|nr:LysR family transcriptional regulator [Pseudomonas aeruginosa]MBP8440919.1 LysR family transcriptional regulator [Pseudomonas aeruginosa]MBP8446985.1 LysR family transcriptional regulator [Pseudomonas aeruginosa]MBP8470796.1 LysR family transcriptional regulator [Pseudomonas aeruginosa]MBP8482297.1 LysR family transcriptional regulator [Pseudomonas aeruginosa]MBP8527586.1 LysR family transcriptional regulator [Pseudomonas aeruginosa]
MELRHLRCFIVLAEELHFARAAERLHIEQSPLSRTIKELEDRLGVRLFDRDRRGTHLTRAGAVFLQDVRRVFLALDQAQESVKAAAAGHFGVLRVAISDGITQPRLASLLASCREEEPTTIIRLTEVSLTEQLRGLRDDTFDIGFARTDECGDNIVSVPLWQEALVVAVPARHPLLAHPVIPINELLRYPLVSCHSETCEGYHRGVERILRSSDTEPNVVERVTSLSMLLTLVAAGYGVGFATVNQIDAYCIPDVVTRPLSMKNPMLTTYLLRKAGDDISEALATFIDRAILNLGDGTFSD